MKILIATPLYPPDIGETAAYSKELAKRLAGSHEVSVLAYGRYPEKIPGVSIFSVDKRAPVLNRLISYFQTLQKAARGTDVIVVINGPSVELPVLIFSLFSSTPILFAIADRAAHERAGVARHILERLVAGHATKSIREFPLPRPEILPFAPKPLEALSSYEDSWSSHLLNLESLFHHAR